jgi:hypothetical protein
MERRRYLKEKLVVGGKDGDDFKRHFRREPQLKCQIAEF